jgi:hypothetical protein
MHAPRVVWYKLFAERSRVASAHAVRDTAATGVTTFGLQSTLSTKPGDTIGVSTYAPDGASAPTTDIIVYIEQHRH